MSFAAGTDTTPDAMSAHTPATSTVPMQSAATGAAEPLLFTISFTVNRINGTRSTAHSTFTVIAASIQISPFTGCEVFI